MRGGGAVIAGRDDPNGWATDLTAAKDVQRRAQRVGHVDEHENRAEGAVGAVQVEFDGPVLAGVQRQERGRCLVWSPTAQRLFRGRCPRARPPR